MRPQDPNTNPATDPNPHSPEARSQDLRSPHNCFDLSLEHILSHYRTFYSENPSHQYLSTHQTLSNYEAQNQDYSLPSSSYPILPLLSPPSLQAFYQIYCTFASVHPYQCIRETSTCAESLATSSSAHYASPTGQYTIFYSHQTLLKHETCRTAGKIASSPLQQWSTLPFDDQGTPDTVCSTSSSTPLGSQDIHPPDTPHSLDLLC
mmetsp:Transcript_8848/g.17593  ORF Transcript_8848/g.17593 Transcript_8848/m.17593 type:complete len:206 (-) Transcript_8848:259-876(-)